MNHDRKIDYTSPPSTTNGNGLYSPLTASFGLPPPIATTAKGKGAAAASAVPPAATTTATSKKRARTSTSGSNNKGAAASLTVSAAASEAGDGDDSVQDKAKKKRLALSCTECRRRKISCDRKQPCSSCIRRKVAHNCDWADESDTSQPFALNSEVRQLARRLAHLESLFQATNPGLMPKDTPALPSTKPSPASLSADFNSPTSSFARRPTLQDETLLESNEGGLAIDDEDAATRQSHSDTEDAAANLEDVTFGARVPVLRAISTASQNTATLKSLKQGTGLELTSALTSILAEPLSYDQDGRPRSAVRLGMDLAISTVDLPLSRSGAMAQIFAVLPGRDISDFLIAKYFAEMEWDFRVLDPEAFPIEHERYVEMLAGGREDEIDPLWVAVFCMVLALSLEGFWSRPNGAKDLALFRGLNERELQDLPSVWHDASLRALQLGEWGGTPRIRTIQTIILFGQYIQLSSSSGQQGRYLGWAASAIRIAQRLGLHRLGSNPETMPPDDPALPPGKNSLKRETAVRLFNSLVLIDTILSDSPTLRCYTLHPSQYNTARPLNLNFRDLSRTEWRTIAPHPLSVHTDASFEIAQLAFAEQVRRALDTLVLSTNAFSYSAVLDQDRAFRQVLEHVPEVFSERCPLVDSERVRYQRALLQEDVYARIVRLHRPFLSRGYHVGSQFRYSTEQCVWAARAIISSNYELLGISTSLWWMFMSSMRSAIVLCMDLFQAIDADRAEEDIKEKRKVLVKASIIFNTQVASPALQAVVEQGRRILTGLFAAEESRRMNRAAHALASANGGSHPSPTSTETFAQVLKRVSRDFTLEEKQQQQQQYDPSQAATPLAIANAQYASPSSTQQYLPLPPAGAPTPMPYGLSPYDYTSGASSWGTTPDAFGSSSLGGLLPANGGGGGASGLGMSALGFNNNAGGQDMFASFFETLASEDWTAASAGYSSSDGGEGTSGLLGQMAATW